MIRKVTLILASAIVVIAGVASGQQTQQFVPVTQEMLQNPSQDDWLMYSRTYDAQRYSPLRQITRQNASQMKLVWSKDMATGTQESIPLVHNGVIYMISTGATAPAGPVVWALDATNGKVIWEYRRPTGGAINSKAIAMYDDLLFYPAPDGFIVALDMRTGAVRWETRAVGNGGRLSSGLLMAGDKVISGRTCGTPPQAGCYIAAHDAKTGKELWKFYTAAGAEDPVADKSWGGAPVETRAASTWGLVGSYDPVKKIIYWGVANPTPNTRAARHQGNPNAIGLSAPADLYSNSTVALNPDTGKLLWYYQHLPGDDWDQDYTNERVLLRTAVSPDPKFVKWINPVVTRGEQRDISVSVGEGGGLFALDRATGQFLWANPFPYDSENFLISKIDPDGKTYINESVINDLPGERHVICSYNTKSYWPMAYHPGFNSMYIPYVDNCLDMTSAVPAGQTAAVSPPVYTVTPSVCAGPPASVPAVAAAAAATPAAPAAAGGGGANAAPGAAPGAAGAQGGGGAPGGGGGRGAAGGGRGGAAGAAGAAAGPPAQGERRTAIRREGSDPQKFSGIAKVNMATGEIKRLHEQCAPGNGAVLATAGDLIFWGDLARNFRAFDAETGKILWETVLPGSIQNSTITYAVNGKQYVAVLTGRGAITNGLITQAGITPAPTNTNGVYVFALP